MYAVPSLEGLGHRKVVFGERGQVQRIKNTLLRRIDDFTLAKLVYLPEQLVMISSLQKGNNVCPGFHAYLQNKEAQMWEKYMSNNFLSGVGRISKA